MTYPVAVAVKYRGGADCSVPQSKVQEEVWKAVLPAFGLSYSKEMLQHLTCSFPDWSGDGVMIMITAPKLSCDGQALAQTLVDLGATMVPDKPITCEVTCLEGVFRAGSLTTLAKALARG